MIDQVVDTLVGVLMAALPAILVAMRRRRLGVVDEVGLGHGLDVFRAAGQADQGRVEFAEVVGQCLGGIALRIDRDEQRMDLAGVRAERVQGPASPVEQTSGQKV